ncbi:hypothetical protein OG444_06615 [Streptomyces sp. NBC_01232]|nr:hypothetical protein OG444_06615 [Streptomyces sp. NBC_01232]
MSVLRLQNAEARTTQCAAATVSPTSGSSNGCGTAHEPEHPD